MELSRLPLPFKQDSTGDFNSYMNQEPQTTSAEATSAAFDLGQFDSAVILAARYSGAKELENSGVSKISALEANQRYPDMPIPFREPINPYIAQLQYDNLKYKDELQRKIENGPNDWWTKSKVFGAGLIAHVMDPIEFGVGSLLGWGVGGIAAVGGFGGKVATAAVQVSKGSARFAARLGINTLEAGTGNLIQNVGQEAATALTVNKEGGTYTPEPVDLVKDLAFNTFAATAFGVGLKEGAFHLNGLKRMLRNTSPEADLAVARAAVGNLENDIRPDPTPIISALAKETSVKPQDFGLPAYDYTPGIEGKKLYAVSKGGESLPVGNDFEIGTQLTDNPAVANAAATRGMADGTGLVHEVSVKDLNPIHLDQPIPENLHELISGDLKDLGFKQPEIDKMSMHEVLTSYQDAIDSGEVSPKIMQELKQDFLKAGYNSLLSDGKDFLGVAHEPHNNVTVLDESLLNRENSLSPAPGVIRQPTPEEVAAAAEHTQNFKNHTLVDGNKFDDIQAKIDSIPDNVAQESVKLKDEVTATLDELNQLKEQNILSTEDIKAAESLKEDFNNLETKASLIKAAAGCIGF